MKLLIVEKLEKDVMDWLGSRYQTRFAPELAADVRGLRLALQDVQAVVLPESFRVDGAWLLHAPELRVAARLSAAEPSERVACEQAGVQWANSSLSNSKAEAEFMLGGLLSLFRRVAVTSVNGAWLGRELGASTVGLLGLSRASKPLVQWLTSMGAKAIGYDPELPANAPVWSRWGIQHVPVQELLQQSDALCIQLNAQHAELLSEARLRFCKRNQVWVSTAPMGVVDQPAVVQALSRGALAAAWFDAVSPLISTAPAAAAGLRQLGNVQLTAGLAGQTLEAFVRAGWEVARRVDQLLLQLSTVDSEGALAARPQTFQLVA